MYAQGVSIATAVLPSGWEDRLITYETEATKPARGLCLEPHNLAISKLVAGREKDYEFVDALIRKELLQLSILIERVNQLTVSANVKRRIENWLSAHT